ncbi:MAG: zinc metallopeptidase [Bacilli bacterium]|nr:zinc metallopeptidase [Bacilli bacterium]
MLINYALPFLGFIITLVAQIYVNNSYNKYKYQGLKNKATGAEIARTILDKNGLKDVKVKEVKGNLTDYYDPKKRVVSLSTDIYQGDTIASASVAAHECGHAIQHKEGYIFLKVRSALVPFVNFSTKIGYLVVIIGLIFSFPKVALIGLMLLLAMLLFQLVTLPVEFNASSRAKKQLIKLNVIDDYELDDSSTMLRAAALTYVASLITTLLQILRLALIVLGRRDD